MKIVLYADEYGNSIEFDGAKITGIHIEEKPPYHNGCICGFCEEKDRPGRFENGEIVCSSKDSCCETILRKIVQKLNCGNDTVKDLAENSDNFPGEYNMIVASRAKAIEEQNAYLQKELRTVSTEYHDKMIETVGTYEKRISELENNIVALQCKLIEVNRKNNEHD